MKRLTLCAAIALAVGLALAPAALASSRAAHVTSHLGHPVHAFAPLAITGPYNIQGHVLDLGGAAIQNAETSWSFDSDALGYTFGGYTLTDASGHFEFDNIPGGNTVDGKPRDELDIDYPLPQGASAALIEMDDWSLDFAATSDYTMQPGAVPLTFDNPPADGLVEVQAGNSEHGYALADVQVTGGQATASVLPLSDFDDVIAYAVPYLSSAPYAIRSEVEWLGTSPVSVAGGATAPGVTLDWGAPLRAFFTGPQCRHSGPAGRAVTLELSGWPASEQADFYGFDSNDNVYSYPGKTVTSLGPTDVISESLAVNAKAPVGLYEIDTNRADNVDSMVDLWDVYQVCTLKASASSIKDGHTVRLSGKVPGGGTVIVYATTHKATVAPSTLAAKGWHKVASCKLKSGKFTTAYLHPTRTTWYVVKYTGYDFPAFTGVCKVAVR